MKKIFKLISLPLLVFTMFGCKKTETGDTVEQTTTSKNKGTVIEKWYDTLTSNIKVEGTLNETITSSLALDPDSGSSTKKVQNKIVEKISDDKFYQDIDGVKHFYEKSKNDDNSKGLTVEKQLSIDNKLKSEVIVRHDDEDNEDYTMEFDAYFTNPFKDYKLDDFFLTAKNSFELLNDRHIPDVVYQLFDTDLEASIISFEEENDKLYVKASGTTQKYGWGWSVEDITFEYNCQISKLDEEPFKDIKVRESTQDSRNLNEALQEMAKINSYTISDSHTYKNQFDEDQSDVEKILVSENAIIDETNKTGYAKFNNNKEYSFTYKTNKTDTSKKDITRVERIDDLNTNEYYKPYYTGISGEAFTLIDKNTFTLDSEVDKISMCNKLFKNESEKRSAEFGIAVGGEYDLTDFKLIIAQENNKYRLKQIEYVLHGEKHSYSYDFNQVNLDAFNNFQVEYKIPDIDKGEWKIDDYEMTSLGDNFDFKNGLTININVNSSNVASISMNGEQVTDIDVIKDNIYFTLDDKEYSFSYIESKPYDGAPDQAFLSYEDSSQGRISITLTRTSDIQ